MSEYKLQACPPEPELAAEHDETYEVEPRLWPMIYVAPTSHGSTLREPWGSYIDATQSPDEILADIQHLVFGASPYSEPADDWIIQNHRDFAGLAVDEHESLDVVSALAQGLHEHGPAFAAWAELDERDPERLAKFADHFHGHHDSAEDYVESLIDALGWSQELDERLEQPLRQYIHIDIAQLSRDLQADSHITVVPAQDGGVWVFDG